MDKKTPIIFILILLSGFFAGAWIMANIQLAQAHSQIPSFLSQTPNNGYRIAYVKDNCVIQLGLRQGVGGIWFEEGHADCPTAESTQTSNYQALINQAIVEHKSTCLAFSPNLNGTTTFSYSTEPLCGDPWHSIVVVSKP